MGHYKKPDEDDRLFYLDSAVFEHMLPEGCVAISDDEAQTIRDTQPKKLKDEGDQ
jgi:hypothetical protein